MKRPELQDTAVLIVEDEPLIAMDLATAFERAGAVTTLTATLEQALLIVEDKTPSAAVIDHVLSDGDTSPLCKRLDERRVPFVVYTGMGTLDGACARGTQVSKPENPDAIVDKVAELLRARSRAGSL
jgi:DNA-binding NtrC family response regulator